jgi:hypothetical protein
MLIHDAQGMAERLFTQLRKSTDRFDVRLIMMNVISRLIGAHDLVLLNFYPFITKYMQPKQKGMLVRYVWRVPPRCCADAGRLPPAQT